MKHRPFAVARVIKGAYQLHGRPAEKKRAMSPEQLRKIVRIEVWRGLVAVRNRAILLFGFAGAFRRSEIVGLDKANVGLGAGGGDEHKRYKGTA